MDINTALGKAFRLLRIRSNMTQKAFANQIGMSRFKYASIELGKQNITLETLSRIAVGFHTSSKELLLIAESYIKLEPETKVIEFKNK